MGLVEIEDPEGKPAWEPVTDVNGSSVRRAIGMFLLAALAACGPQPAEQSGRSANGACDLSNFLAVQHAHVNRAEVTLCGTVMHLHAPRRTRSGVHRRFDVDVGHNNPVEIDANIDVIGNFPIHDGEPATVRGEYYDDSNGREGVHWTHRSDRGTHPAGWITLDGRTYR